MEEIEDFKNIVTFTFHDNNRFCEIIVGLLQKKYQAKKQDQSTYGIPNVDLKVEEIRALCIEALNDNNYNYDSSDEVRLFKPVNKGRLIMHKIIPYDVQKESTEDTHNRGIRRTKEININVN